MSGSPRQGSQTISSAPAPPQSLQLSTHRLTHKQLALAAASFVLASHLHDCSYTEEEPTTAQQQPKSTVRSPPHVQNLHATTLIVPIT